MRIVALTALVFAAGLGLPLPASAMLLAAGALAARGQLPLSGALLAPAAALFVADLVWYQLGRWRGERFLARLPTPLLRRVEPLLARHQRIALVISKFVPGLHVAAPSLAGARRMKLAEFVAVDLPAALLWSAALVAIAARLEA